MDYFAAPDLTGTPHLREIQPKSELSWFGAMPAGVNPQQFSLRATGRFTPKAPGDYTFSLVSVGRSRFFIDGREVIERVARRLQAQDVAAGVEIIREGDRGDQFYLVEAGELEVVHGAARVRRLTAGDHFGEIALLRGTLRSATVRAVETSRLLRLESGDFLAAVTQHSTSSDRLESVVAARLDTSAEIKKGQSSDCP